MPAIPLGETEPPQAAFPAWPLLKRGVPLPSLTGRYRREQEPEEGTRLALPRAGPIYRQRYCQDAQFDAVERLRDFFAPRERSPHRRLPPVHTLTEENLRRYASSRH